MNNMIKWKVIEVEEKHKEEISIRYKVIPLFAFCKFRAGDFK